MVQWTSLLRSVCPRFLIVPWTKQLWKFWSNYLCIWWHLMVMAILLSRKTLKKERLYQFILPLAMLECTTLPHQEGTFYKRNRNRHELRSRLYSNRVLLVWCLKTTHKGPYLCRAKDFHGPLKSNLNRIPCRGIPVKFLNVSFCLESTEHRHQ